MLESIGESAVRIAAHANNQSILNNSDVAHQKTAEAVNEPPVVASQESSNTESYADQKTGSYNSDDKGIFYEKYDVDGNVILRVPQEHINVDESV